MDDRGSSATVSERNAESLFDTQDDINVAGQDGDEKHVSWWGVQTDDSPEKGNCGYIHVHRVPIFVCSNIHLNTCALNLHINLWVKMDKVLC